jgi:Cof subfamily protein (haloacid dehalogenase superfamily)
MFQVVVSDLDGTLLGSDSKVDPFTASTLSQVAALGIKLVLATGRHYLDASHFRDALGIRAHLISANGARAHDPDGLRIVMRDLDPAVARALMSPEITGRRHLSAFVDEGWLVNRPCPELDAYFQGSGFVSHVRDLASHDGEGLSKVGYMGEKADLARLEAEILERFGGRVGITSSSDRFLEVMAPIVSKADALTEVLLRLGVPASACIAFGDGQNDIEMLSVVGRPFVMSGSSPKLLAALPQAPSAGSNDEAGVACTLREIFGLSTDRVAGDGPGARQRA